MIGTFIIIIAVISMILDPYAKRIGEESNIIGALVALSASIPQALYFKIT